MQTNEEAFRKVCAIQFQIFLHPAEWVSEQAEWVREREQCQGAQEGGFSLRSTGWFGGVEIMLKCAAALQEYSREKENKTQLQTCWARCSAEFEFFKGAGRVTKT